MDACVRDQMDACVRTLECAGSRDRIRRHAAVGRICLSILLALAPACSSKASKAATPAGGGPAVPVAVAAAAKADVPIEIRAIGTVEPAATVAIKPQIDGLVVDIRIEEGADVRAGDLLLQIDPRPSEAALHAVEADLARDMALSADAKSAAAQLEGALQKSAVSQRSTDQARATAAAAEAAVLKDRSSLENAKLQLEYCSITAPFDGRTGELGVRRGSAVKAHDTELLTLRQIVPIRVAFAVPEQHLAGIRQASAAGPLAVQVQVAGGGPPVEGVLTFIDNSVDRTTGTIRLMATFPNEDRGLWPGQYLQATLRTGIERDAVLVPSRAVQSGQQGDFVFVVGQNSTVEARAVRVGRLAGEASVVADGLSAGEVVVTDGQLRLVPGARVETQGQHVPESGSESRGGSR